MRLSFNPDVRMSAKSFYSADFAGFSFNVGMDTTEYVRDPRAEVKGAYFLRPVFSKSQRGLTRGRRWG